MVSCCVNNCIVTRTYNPDKYTFHRFPSQPELKQKWLRIINRPKWSPHKNTTICSKHFDEKCFIQRKSRRVLMKNSIPTLFVPIKVKQERLPSSYINRDITIPSEELQPPSNTTPKPLSKLMDRNTRLRKKILEKNKVLKTLRTKIKRMSKRIITLHEVIKGLKHNKLENHLITNLNYQNMIRNHYPLIEIRPLISEANK